MLKAAASIRNVRALSAFATRAGPIFWSRMVEDRRRAILSPPQVPRISEWPRLGLQAAWIGYSTVLIRLDGFTILTDLVFSPRIGIRIGPMVIGMKRLIGPALDVREVPGPDLILISHAHM